MNCTHAYAHGDTAAPCRRHPQCVRRGGSGAVHQSDRTEHFHKLLEPNAATAVGVGESHHVGHRAKRHLLAQALEACHELSGVELAAAVGVELDKLRLDALGVVRAERVSELLEYAAPLDPELEL